jgi:hypothetical protein
VVDAAAHALTLGLDWRSVIEDTSDEVELLVVSAVMQRAVDFQHERDKRLATMTGNAVNGVRSLDGRRTPSSTSTRHG